MGYGEEDECSDFNVPYHHHSSLLSTSFNLKNSKKSFGSAPQTSSNGHNNMSDLK